LLFVVKPGPDHPVIPGLTGNLPAVPEWSLSLSKGLSKGDLASPVIPSMLTLSYRAKRVYLFAVVVSPVVLLCGPPATKKPQNVAGGAEQWTTGHSGHP